MSWPWTWIFLITLGAVMTAIVGAIGSILVMIGCFGLCVLTPTEEAHSLPVSLPTRSTSFEETHEAVLVDERGRRVGLRQSRVWTDHS